MHDDVISCLRVVRGALPESTPIPFIYFTALSPIHHNNHLYTHSYIHAAATATPIASAPSPAFSTPTTAALLAVAVPLAAPAPVPVAVLPPLVELGTALDGFSPAALAGSVTLSATPFAKSFVLPLRLLGSPVEPVTQPAPSLRGAVPLPGQATEATRAQTWHRLLVRDGLGVGRESGGNGGGMKAKP